MRVAQETPVTTTSLPRGRPPKRNGPWSGYTHLLINRGELARLAGRYPVLPWASEEGRLRFQELLDLLAPPVARAGEAGLFALGP